jgi:D-sedoheptulose 7-phosphate isomerase
VVVPTLVPERVTPHVEAFQGVLMHLFVSHPLLQRATAKWEAAR